MHVADIKSLSPPIMPPYDLDVPATDDDEAHVSSCALSA